MLSFAWFLILYIISLIILDSFNGTFCYVEYRESVPGGKSAGIA
jgi:hypothetical protein